MAHPSKSATDDSIKGNHFFSAFLSSREGIQDTGRVNCVTIVYSSRSLSKWKFSFLANVWKRPIEANKLKENDIFRTS